MMYPPLHPPTSITLLKQAQCRHVHFTSPAHEAFTLKLASQARLQRELSGKGTEQEWCPTYTHTSVGDEPPCPSQTFLPGTATAWIT